MRGREDKQGPVGTDAGGLNPDSGLRSSLSEHLEIMTLDEK